jgi:hypothetical protein
VALIHCSEESVIMRNIPAGSPRTAFQHLRRTLFRALRNILVFGVLGFLLGAGVTEAVAVGVSGVYPPTTLTHVASAIIGVLLGYAIAVTIAFSALLTGLVESAEWVVSEVERLVGGVVHEAESVLHLPGELAHGASAPVPAQVGGAGPAGRPSGGLIGGIQDEP